jgi:exopolyphosphatase/guanosine-5'-triphosphate,3'-diphosphate pyrophosphatase
MIMEALDLPLERRERRMVAAVARYHRKALPEDGHQLVSSMGASERRKLLALASMLRLADALDSTHSARVKHVKCEISSDRLILHCGATGGTEMEERDAFAKGDLIQDVLGLRLEIQWDVA